jgi:hypothetical protein
MDLKLPHSIDISNHTLVGKKHQEVMSSIITKKKTELYFHKIKIANVYFTVDEWHSTKQNKMFKKETN